MNIPFRNRTEAGRFLARKLMKYAGHGNVLVLALPRGVAPVAFEVASALGAPLDVLVVRKLGVPGREELAMGAIASGGVRVINHPVVEAMGIPDRVIDAVEARERRELDRREKAYRGNRPFPDVEGQTVILVDDGVATGSTALAAIGALRQLGAQRIVMAAPTVARSTYGQLIRAVDDFAAVIVPEEFFGVGEWYEDFSQTTDEEVRTFLEQAEERNHPVAA